MAIKRGSSAIKSALAENNGGGSNVAFTPFKTGMTYKLRVQSVDDIVEYQNASVFGVFKSSAVVSSDNLYQKAAQALYKQADAIKDEAGKKEIVKRAGLIRPKPKYILGAIDLETGEKVFIDLTKNQAKVVISLLQKKAKKLDSTAFELAKSGKDTDTVVTITQLDDDELDAKELATFEKSAGIEFTDEEFESLVFEKDFDEQLDDIYAFDRKLAESLDPSKQGAGSAADVDLSEDSLPF